MLANVMWRIVLLLLTFPRVALAGPRLSGNGYAIEYRNDGGARVTVNGVPIIRASSLQLHAPDWKQGYYSSNNAPRTVEASDDGRTITVRHTADKHVKFVAVETYRLLADNQVEITLSGRLDSDVPANIEWAIGYVNAFTPYGGQYEDGLTVAARVFVWTNPHPDKPIDSVTFSTDHPYASPVLLALSGIDAAPK